MFVTCDFYVLALKIKTQVSITFTVTRQMFWFVAYIKLLKLLIYISSSSVLKGSVGKKDLMRWADTEKHWSLTARSGKKEGNLLKNDIKKKKRKKWRLFLGGTEAGRTEDGASTPERPGRRKVDPRDVLDRSQSVTAEWLRTHGINDKYSRLVNNGTLTRLCSQKK